MNKVKNYLVVLVAMIAMFTVSPVLAKDTSNEAVAESVEKLDSKAGTWVIGATKYEGVTMTWKKVADATKDFVKLQEKGLIDPDKEVEIYYYIMGTWYRYDVTGTEHVNESPLEDGKVDIYYLQIGDNGSYEAKLALVEPEEKETTTITFMQNDKAVLVIKGVVVDEVLDEESLELVNNTIVPSEGKEIVFTDEEGNEFNIESDKVTENLVLNISEDDIKYTATFALMDSMSGVEAALPESQTIIINQKVQQPSNLELDNLTFKGWYVKDESGEYEEDKYDFNGTPVTEDITIYALFTAEVQFVNSATGSTFTSRRLNVLYGDTVSEDYVEVNTRQGYTAVWYNGEDKYDFATPVTEDMTLTLDWEANDINVTYVNLLPGSGEEVKTVKYDSEVATPEVVENYNFAGWYLDEEYTTPYEEDTLTEEITLYAKWTTTVTYVVDPDDEDKNQMQEVVYGSKVNALAVDPEKAGYIFDGWFADEDATEEFDFDSEITEPTMIYAGYTQITYILHVYDEDKTTKLMDDIIITMDEDGRYTTMIPRAVKGDKVFNRYEKLDETDNRFGFNDSGHRATEVVAGTENNSEISVYVVLDEPSLYITFVDGSFSQRVPAGYNRTVVVPEELTEEVYGTTKEGYDFDGWFYNGNRVNNITQRRTSDAVYEARWTIKSFNVEVYAIDPTNDNAVVDVDTLVHNYNTTVSVDELNAPAYANYSLVKWYADAELTTEYDFATPVTADVELYAKYERDFYNVTFNNDGFETVVEVASGSTVDELAVEPKVGYDFIGWFEADEDVAYDFNAEIHNDVTLYAVWNVKQIRIDFVGYQYGDFSDFYDYGDEFDDFNDLCYYDGETPCFVEETYYQFAGWYTDEDYATPFAYGTELTDLDGYTLYAKLLYPVVYGDTITFDIIGEETYVVRGTVLENIELESVPAGFRHIGWIDGETGLSYNFAPITDAVVLVTDYMVTINIADVDGSIIDTFEVSQTSGSIDLGSYSIEPAAGYELTGWADNNGTYGSDEVVNFGYDNLATPNTYTAVTAPIVVEP